MERKSSKKKKKQKDKECLNNDSVRNDFTEIKQKGSKKQEKEANSRISVEENGQEKQDADEGSQSSMRDFVSLNEQKKSKKKKKEKENKCTITNSETKKGHLKKKKQKDEGCRSSVTKDFTEADQIGPKKKKRKEKGNRSNCTAATSGKKHKNSKEKMQNGDESSRTAAHCTLQQDNPKKKGKVGKSRTTDSETEKNHPKKKKGRGKESLSNNETNCALDQTISNKITDLGKACTSTKSNSEMEENGPRKNKEKGKEGTNHVTNAESGHNYSKKRKGKDDRESSSSATNSKKGQKSSKKRKGNLEIKPGSSKKRKINNSLQQSLEERGIMEDAFLIQHPQLVHDLKGQLYCEGLEGSSFTAISAMLKECILREKWEDAGRILCTMCMYQTPDVECLWKFGAHVLQNHPNGKAELVEDLYRFVRKINLNNPYQKKLEHALFLLREDRMKDALATLTEMWVRTRGKVQQSNQQEILEKMTSAYTGLIEYCLWHDKTKNSVDYDQEKEAHTSKEAATLRKRALSNLSKINDDPGVWDIFIRKQVEKLVTILPAEDYTLDYVELLEQTGSAELVEVLPMLFNMADYSTCHCNTALWKSLVDHVISVVESRKDKIGKTVLKDCWSCRKSWWTSYHFDKHEASELVKKNPKVALQKAILAAILFGSSYPFVQKVQSAIQKSKPGLSKELENELALWCNPAL